MPDGGPDPAVALREAAVRVIPRVAFTTPGEVFSYSNVGYLLAGRLIEVAAGRRYDQQIGAALLAPLGMVSSTFDPAVAATAALAQGTPDSGAVVPPPSAAMWPIAGLHSSVDELSHFAIAFLDDGLYRGRRVLSRESVARIATPVASFQSGEGDYGYGVRVYRHRGLDVVEHGGTGQDGYRAVLYMVPARRVAVIVVANRAGRRPYEVVDVALDAVVPGLPAAPAPRVSDTPLPGDMEEYVGSYVNGVALQVSVDDGVLVLHQGAQALPIRRTDDGRLVAIGEQGPAWIAFVRGPDRRVKYLHYNMRAFRRQQ